MIEEEWDAWDQEIINDFNAGKLDAMIEEAIADDEAGKTEELLEDGTWARVPLKTIPVFFTPLMVADSYGYSPSPRKPGLVVDAWQRLGIPLSIIEPEPVTIEQLKAAHDPALVDGIMDSTLPNGFGNTSPAIARSLPYTSGSMLSAAREAIENGRVAVAPCSGFHHAGWNRPEGFCTFNGLMVTALALHAEGIKKIAVLDLDMHYGNGTDNIIDHFAIDWIVHHSEGKQYRSATNAPAFLKSIDGIIERMKGCEIILYQAGADPHINDPLGGWLNTKQLHERDRLVFRAAKERKIPIAWNLAGGYQSPLNKVLDIHDNTMRACVEVYLG